MTNKEHDNFIKDINEIKREIEKLYMIDFPQQTKMLKLIHQLKTKFKQIS